MAEDTITGRSALLRLSRKYGGKWAEVYAAIKGKEDVAPLPEPSAEELLGWTPVTYFDEEYPQRLMADCVRPPLVLYCRGDVSLLSRNSILLYVCENRPGDNPHPAVDNLIWDVAREGIVPVVCWRPVKGGGQLATVLKAHETTKRPLIVCIPRSAKDPEGLAERVAAFGGLAIRESFPGSERTLSQEEERIPAALCSACLVAGGDRGAQPMILLSFALNAGRPVGAVAYAMGDPDGHLCLTAIKSGATPVDSLPDVKALLGVD